MKKYAALFFVLILFAASLACGSETPVVVSTAVPPAEKTQPPAATEKPVIEPTAIEPTAIVVKTYHVGDVIALNDMTITVNEVTYPAGDTYYKPEAGKKFIVIDLTIENKSASSISVSSLLQMSMKDDTGQRYSMDFSASIASGGTTPDGEVVPGDKLRGQVGFQIPETATGLVFIFDTDILGEGQIFISIP